MDGSQDDDTPASANPVLRSFLGQAWLAAVVARVRASRGLRDVLIEAVGLATFLGWLGWLVGLPVRACFLGTLTLYGEAVLQVQFTTTHEVYKAWTRFRRKAYLTFGIFVVVRSLIGRVFPFPSPVMVYAQIAELGGLHGLFWSTDIPDAVLFEICLDVLLVTNAVNVAFDENRNSRRLLATMVIVLFFLTLRPVDWAAADECAVARGLIRCSFEGLSSLLFGR